MSDLQAERNPVEVLADEFASRVRGGEHPLISEYVSRFPEHATEINELFPSILMMERLKHRDDAARRRELRYRKLGKFQHIGDYQIVRQIGRGGMGVVFEAIQKSLGRRVAMKVLTDSAMASPKQVQRFDREARAAAALHHTNIVPVFGVGHEDDLHFYVMQHIHGTGLDEILAALRALAREQIRQPEESDGSRAGSAIELARALQSNSFVGPPPMNSGSEDVVQHHETRAEQFDAPTVEEETVSDDSDPRLSTDHSGSVSEFLTGAGAPQRLFGPQYYKAVARLAVQVANALQYAHGQGVLHRDIKPGNLLLDPQGTVWVTDFGLAKLTEHKDLTNSGDIVGTLRYMAPEQFDGDFDARGDVYSLGLTLYELLTLRPACDDTAIRKMLDQRAQDRVAKPRSLNPAIPRDLETIVLKMVSAEPKDRYQTAEALAADLDRYLEDRPIEARRVTPVERFIRWSRRNPALAASTSLAITLLLLITVTTAWGYVHEKGQKQKISAQKAVISEANERAEANFALALTAFGDIMNNLRSRGVSQTLDLAFESEEIAGEAPEYISVATPADAELLNDLRTFFDRFARQNSANLQAETAKAYHFMGDIQSRLGNHEAAKAAYRSAIALYEKLEPADADKVMHLVAWAEALNDLALLERRTWGRGGTGRELNLAARDLLTRQPPKIGTLPQIRFALAQTYLSSLQRGPGPRSGRPGGRGNSPGKRRSGSGQSGRAPNRMLRPGPDRRVMLDSALNLLKGLREEDRDNAAYRLALADALRRQVGMAGRKGLEATEAHEESISILERLVEDFPDQPRYRFELAGRLSDSSLLSDCPHVSKRLARAATMAEELVQQFPSIIAYQRMLVQCLSRCGHQERRLQNWETAIAHYRAAIDAQELIAKQDPDSFWQQLSLDHWNRQLAATLREQGALEESRLLLERMIKELESLAGTSGDGRSLRLGFFCGELAATLREQGELEGSRQLLEKTILDIESLDGPFVGVRSRFLFRVLYGQLAKTLEKMGDADGAADALTERNKYSSGSPNRRSRRSEGNGTQKKSSRSRTSTTNPQ